MATRRTATLCLVLVFVAPLMCRTVARTIYLDATGGSDSNNGLSPDTAWRTFANLPGQLQPGDRVLLKRGEQWRATLTAPASGTVDRPIVFAAYGNGPLPVISAADAVSGWDLLQENIWRAQLPVRPRVLYVILQDGSLLHGQGVKNTDRLEQELQYCWQAGVLYMYCALQPDIAFRSVEAGQRDCAVSDGQITRSYLVFQHLELRGANAEWGGAIDFRGYGGPITLEECHIRMNASMGVMMVNSGARVSGCAILHCLGGSLLVHTEAAGWLVEDCELAYSFSGVSLYGPSAVLQGNHIHHHRMNGIFIVSSGHTIRYNAVHDNGQADYEDFGDMTQKFELYSGGGDANSIYYNLFYNGSPHGGAGIYLDNGTAGCLLANNVICNMSEGTPANPHGIGYVLENGFGITQNNHFLNNICANCRVAVAFADDIGANNLQGNRFDFNCYFLGDIGESVAYADGFKDLSAWQDMAGHPDTHSMAADPLFVSPGWARFGCSCADYHLQACSPCINQGTCLGLAYDFAGTQVPYGAFPEIGAYEFTGLLCPDINRDGYVNSLDAGSLLSAWYSADILSDLDQNGLVNQLDLLLLLQTL